MPITGFICPDGEAVSLEDCFRECRIKHLFQTGRCKALPFLKRAGKDRPWDGKLSSTQILTGTREILLKVTKPYHINPSRKVAAIIGTNTHNILYRLTDSTYAEETLYNELIKGTYDMYDPETGTLYDYKTWGAWKIVKALSEDTSQRADALFDVTVQMNQYRILLKQKYPQLEIKQLAVQVISRETNLKTTRQMGLMDDAPVILIPEIDSSIIERYQAVKNICVQKAFLTDWAPLCRERETWGGKKCSGYCDVSHICGQQPTQTEDIEWWLEQEAELQSIEEKIIDLIKKFQIKS
jgi:hypothetical protein